MNLNSIKSFSWKRRFSKAMLMGGVLVSGCSTLPIENDRDGLLEVFASLPSASKWDTQKDSNSIAANRLGQWRWPLKRNRVTSRFGRRGRRQHEGIDLKAKVGTSVFAANTGEVVYSGNRIRGYGRMIVLDHGKGLYTVYAHHSRNMVSEGDRVERGQKIALSGRSGRVSGPHLHFEVRRGSEPMNPLKILPKRRTVASQRR